MRAGSIFIFLFSDVVIGAVVEQAVMQPCRFRFPCPGLILCYGLTASLTESYLPSFYIDRWSVNGCDPGITGLTS